MNLQFFLQHGWGYDGEVWQKWQILLPSDPIIACRGYFSSTPSSHEDISTDIVITHSLGLHLISENILEHCKLLVIISGFQEFHPNSPEKKHLSRSSIRKMLHSLHQKENDVLSRFHSRATRPKNQTKNISKTICWDILKRDLSLLNNNALSLKKLKALNKILVIHGENDAIVSVEKAEELHKQLPNSQLVIISNAGHALPLTHASACWREISLHLPYICKKHIGDNFSRCAENYHQHAQVQKKSAQDLLFTIKEENITSGNILEIGCGTGFVTEGLLHRFPQHPLLVTDLAPGMLDICKKKLSPYLSDHQAEVTFSVYDGEEEIENLFSMIISGMTFQLFDQLPRALQQLFSSLKNHGLLVFSCLEDHSFHEWRKVAESCDLPFTRIPLYKRHEIELLARKLDPYAEVVEKSYSLSHPSPSSFFHDLKKIGSGSPSLAAPRLTRAQWSILLESWKKQAQGDINITYNIAYVKIRKNHHD